jgi:hypothetical protein
MADDSHIALEPKQALIRMYGQGLGDCFLLAFHRSRPTVAVPAVDRERPVFVLIDCGVLGRTPDASARIKQVVEDIRDTTADPALPLDGNRHKGHLDLLILTHEHQDHLSGFQYNGSRAIWDEIQVDAVWTAWTAADDPKGLGGILKRLRDQQDHALQRVATLAERFHLEDRLELALSLREFLDRPPEMGALSVREGLDFARRLADSDRQVICEPGDVRSVPGSDATAYVLGPPRTWKHLSKMNPTGGAEETYENEMAVGMRRRQGLSLERELSRMTERPSALNAFAISVLHSPLAAAGANGGDGAGSEEEAAAMQDLYERSHPFDRTRGVPIPTAESESARRPIDFPALATYFDDVNHWRRIDADWLFAAEEYAAWVDNLINNTSLALAFELPPRHDDAERNVLLFAADAQVGNWLSWDELGAWQARDGAQPSHAEADMDQLFRRTVFYKVGHHGSHNATLKERGVERMRTDGKLTAFVPVSAPVAQIADWDKMPLKNLMDALSERTGGRVVLSNGTVWPLPLAQKEENAAARKRINVRASRKQLKEKCISGDCAERQIEDKVPLWVQITVGY